MQDLHTLLSSAPVDMTGITLMHAAGVSQNGAFIFGLGKFPDSAAMPYVVHLGG
jgi:hypothetical protein